MTMKLHDTHRGRPQALLPQNRGMSKVVQEKIDQVVGQANREAVEAIKTDGRPVRVWKKRLRGGVPCTCSFTPRLSHALSVGLDNGFDQNVPNHTFDLEENNADQSPKNVFGFTVVDEGETVLKDTVVNQPRANAAPITLDAGDGQDYSEPQHTGKSSEDSAFIDLSDVANVITGGERKPCGVCFGTGFVDGLSYLSGMRIVLDARGFAAKGATLVKDIFPHRFKVSRVSDSVVWPVMLPTYFEKAIAVRVRNDRDVADGLTPEVSIDGGSTWAALTVDWLTTRNTIPTNALVRVRPTTTVLDGLLVFSHLEILIDTVPLPYAQFPQIQKFTSFELIDYAASISISLDPSLPPVEREGIIEDTITGEIWKITDIANRTTAKGQGFGFTLNVRKVQTWEPSMLLRFGTGAQQTHAFRGLETTQGNVQQDQLLVTNTIPAPETMSGFTQNDSVLVSPLPHKKL